MDSQDTDQLRRALELELDDAARQAWTSLSRYKFLLFGYWAGVWVHLNRLDGGKRPNPWGDLVKIARAETIARDLETGKAELEAERRAELAANGIHLVVDDHVVIP